MHRTDERVAIIGLGYVGLPVALGFSDHFANVTAFDIDRERVAALNSGIDATGEVEADRLAKASVAFVDDPDRLVGHSLYVVCVPTPITADRSPDLGPIKAACQTVGIALRTRSDAGRMPIVVFESTVYPGLTEEVCVPLLRQASGLVEGDGFDVGYSPERINPGDRRRTLDRIVKVVAGRTPTVTARLQQAYEAVVSHAGVYPATSIAVAEAAKVLENTQRDLNIALMNEMALICARLGIRTADVLAAAGTKWNFQHYSPGLVGGHCIGVDPYYLTAKAQEVGHHPEIILAGRRLNDSMATFVAGQIVKLLIAGGRSPLGARVGVLGVTFKENVADLRNSQIPRVIKELQEYGVVVLAHDDRADDKSLAMHLSQCAHDLDHLRDLDALVLAVPHDRYLDLGVQDLCARLKTPGAVLVDLKSRLEPDTLPTDVLYWSL